MQYPVDANSEELPEKLPELSNVTKRKK